MKKISQKRKGFTLVELALALVFVSILLITIAWLTLHLTTVYQKGLAMKAISSTGKELIDDFSRAISASPAITLDSLCDRAYNKSDSARKAQYDECVKDSARHITYRQNYNKVKIKGVDTTVPINGIFCTGRYSYIWNTAYALNPADYEKVNLVDYKATLSIGGSTPITDFRLLKVSDFDRSLCYQKMEPNTYDYSSNYNYTLDSSPYTLKDLLDNSENDIAVYDLSVFAPTIHEITGSAFYSGTFVLATLRGGIDINSTGEFCSDPPDNLNTDFAYCAINKFNFAMQANGERIDGE